jgi:phosphoglycerate dehydrogenase-like enzyme
MHVVYMEPLPAELEALVRASLPAECSLRIRHAEEDPATLIGDADCVIVAVTPLTAHMIQAAPRLRLIQHQGVGYNNIDLHAAARAGIPVALAPSGTAESVAEHSVLLMLSLYRCLLIADGALRRGEWLQWQLRSCSYNLAGKCVGIVGLGRIGRALAARLGPFGCEVVYFDLVRPSTAVEAELAVRFLPFEELLGCADLVSLHVPLNASTRGLINQAALARMRPSSLLINTARGGIVDEQALYAALSSGGIAGAGLDVFADEPLPAKHALLQLNNVVVTPHIAAGTLDSLRAKLEAAAANIRRVMQGVPPLDQVCDALDQPAPAL